MATVFGEASFSENGKEVLFEKISRVEVEGDNLRLENFLGEKKSITAKIKEIDFVNSKIVLKGESRI